MWSCSRRRPGHQHGTCSFSHMPGLTLALLGSYALVLWSMLLPQVDLVYDSNGKAVTFSGLPDARTGLNFGHRNNHPADDTTPNVALPATKAKTRKELIRTFLLHLLSLRRGSCAYPDGRPLCYLQ